MNRTTVYIVVRASGNPFESRVHIVAVFSSEELAAKYIENEEYREALYIDERDVDDSIESEDG